MAIGSLNEIVFDSSNPEALARFWQALIGGEVDVEGDDWAALDGGDAEGFYIVFQRVPERKSAKNRVHLDVDVDDLEAATDEAELLGARKIGDVVDHENGAYQVMADPDGNEFCLLAT